MKKYGDHNISFRGFMVDSAYANWIGVHIVFESGNPNEPMEGMERTCKFHSS